MTLRGTVIKMDSASRYVDGVQRVTIRFSDADDFNSDIQIRNTEGFKLDDEVVFELVDIPESSKAATT